jgi:hypothetical protein
MPHQTVIAGQVFPGPASGKMLDGSLLVGEKNKDVHPLEVALTGHCGGFLPACMARKLVWAIRKPEDFSIERGRVEKVCAFFSVGENTR